MAFIVALPLPSVLHLNNAFLVKLPVIILETRNVRCSSKSQPDTIKIEVDLNVKEVISNLSSTWGSPELLWATVHQFIPEKK